MAEQPIPPLSGNNPITDKEGRPRPFFILLINQLLKSSVASALALAQAAMDAVTALATRVTTLEASVGTLQTDVENLQDTQILGGVGINGGGMIGDGDITLDLADTAVTPGTYGDATHSAQITVDQQGRITGAVDVPISGGGGGGGSLVLINRQVLAATATTIAFAAIPGTYTDLILSISARSSAAALAADINIQFNGDTGAHYESWNDNRFGGGQTIPTAAPTISTVEAASSALYCFPSEILIPGYAITAFYKSAQSMGGTRDSNLYRQNRGLAWLNTAAITDILLILTSGNFVVGSVFSLYGRT